MNNLKVIRKQLKLTQAELAKLIGCTQGNIGHYENKNQTIKPEVAQRIVSVARERGLNIAYEDIYAEARMKEVQIVKEAKPNIQVLGDAFGGTHILLNGRSFIIINYITPWIDNAGMRSLSNDIVKLLQSTSSAQGD
jgi:putative transcriptional regulator